MSLDSLRDASACSAGLFDVAVVTLPSAVPEPSTWTMMTLGFTDVGSTAYRTRKNGAVLGAAYPPMPRMIRNARA
jgi:hypothetical protein